MLVCKGASISLTLFIMKINYGKHESQYKIIRANRRLIISEHNFTGDRMHSSV